MRISDWSSDVCSSDLHGGALSPRQSAERAEDFHMPMDPGEIERLIKEGLPDAQIHLEDLVGDGDQIGRASCRESVSVSVDLGGRRIIKQKIENRGNYKQTKIDIT